MRPMPSRISDVIFSEPSGRRHAVVMFSGAFLLSSLYVYNGLSAGSFSLSWLFFMIGGSILSGIAESLPADRRRAAGILRITAVLVLLCLLVTIIVAPEFIVGER
jgi:hypothetical protein